MGRRSEKREYVWRAVDSSRDTVSMPEPLNAQGSWEKERVIKREENPIEFIEQLIIQQPLDHEAIVYSKLRARSSTQETLF
jgi:hypothetical protein